MSLYNLYNFNKSFAPKEKVYPPITDDPEQLIKRGAGENSTVIITEREDIQSENNSNKGIIAGYNVKNKAQNGGFIVGTNNENIGDWSNIEGASNYNGSNYSHVEGEGCRINTGCPQSHAEGYQTEVKYSTAGHAEGIQTKAGGQGGHAEGYKTESSGQGAHAEGSHTKAYNNSSHAEGYHTQATGNFSHAEGDTTEATGEATHAGGYHTQSTGDYSFTHGKGLETKNEGEAAFGTYNVSNNQNQKKTIFSVGKGSNNNNRLNALEITDGEGSLYKNLIFTTEKSADPWKDGGIIINNGDSAVKINPYGIQITTGYTDEQGPWNTNIRKTWVQLLSTSSQQLDWVDYLEHATDIPNALALLIRILRQQE